MQWFPPTPTNRFDAGGITQNSLYLGLVVFTPTAIVVAIMILGIWCSGVHSIWRDFVTSDQLYFRHSIKVALLIVITDTMLKILAS